MSSSDESFNKELYDLLKVRGYHPLPLDSKNQRVNAPQNADVIQFMFTKDGHEYGKVWVSVDKASKIILYYDNEQVDSPNDITKGVEYDDTWTGLLKNLKDWAMRRQLSFDLKNRDRLGDDMAQREHYKMKEKLGEGYYPMGKKASYSDSVPNVKVVIQHTRQIEEGEQRFRNIARIFVENTDGEKFLLPTIRPGIARVYARHIAEGGTPYDERGRHITSLVEEYNKMAGFVRATRNTQFNESVQSLVNEGISHYKNLRETLNKMTGHRGYNVYFESYTPTLMEAEGTEDISEMFKSSKLDPRIESAMPILSRLHKQVNEVTELSEWADSIANESNLGVVPYNSSIEYDYVVSHPDFGKKKIRAKNADEAKRAVAKLWGISFRDIKAIRGNIANTDTSDDSLDDPNPLNRAKATAKASRNRFKGLVRNVFKLSEDDNQEMDEALEPWMTGDPDVPAFQREKEFNQNMEKQVGPPAIRRVKDTNPNTPDSEKELDENLGPEQKRVGQLGPTEKVGPKGAVGKLVGASESVDPDLSRIRKLSGL